MCIRDRITAQPSYVLAASEWIDPALADHVAALSDPETGLALDTRPVPLPWPAVA